MHEWCDVIVQAGILSLVIGFAGMFIGAVSHARAESIEQENRIAAWERARALFGASAGLMLIGPAMILLC